MKDYSHATYKVVHLRDKNVYTGNSTGRVTTENLMDANHWFVSTEDEKILNLLAEDLREQAKIYKIIIIGMILEE